MIYYSNNVTKDVDKSKFMIFGERNTGTNYLESLFLKNFKMKYENIIMWKHWMGFLNYPNAKEGTENILSVGIVRDPLDWLASMHKNPSDAPHMVNLTWDEFISREWYTTYEGKEYPLDLNYKTNERYKNILELRQNKLEWLFNPDIPGPYCLIRYEDLKDNPEKVLRQIASEFGLKMGRFIPVTKDVKAGGRFKEKKRNVPNHVVEVVKNKGQD